LIHPVLGVRLGIQHHGWAGERLWKLANVASGFFLAAGLNVVLRAA